MDGVVLISGSEIKKVVKINMLFIDQNVHLFAFQIFS